MKNILLPVVLIMLCAAIFSAQPAQPIDREKAAQAVIDDYRAKYGGKIKELFDKGDHYGSMQMATRVLLVDPQNTVALHHRAKTLYNFKQYERAERDFRQLLKLDQSDGIAHYILGMILMETGRSVEALPYMRRALELNPASLPMHVGAGQVFQHAGQYRECVDAFDFYLQKEPSKSFIRQLKGFCLAEMGRRAEAKAEYDKVIEQNFQSRGRWQILSFQNSDQKCHGTADSYLKEADNYLRNKQNHGAYQSLYLALKCDPKNVAATVAMIKLEAGDKENQVEAVNRAHQAKDFLPPDALKGVLLLDGKTSVATGIKRDEYDFYKNFKDGESLFKANAAMNGEMLGVGGIGLSQTAEGYVKLAQDVLANGSGPYTVLLYANQALLIDPNNLDALLMRARMYAAAGDPALKALAYRDAKAVLARDPKQSLAYNALGLVYDNEKNYDLAVANFSKAIELDSNNDRAYGNRSRIYLEQKKDALALADANKAVALAPTNSVWMFYRAGAASRINNLQLAYDSYFKVIQAQPNHYDARVLLIGVMDKMGKKAEGDEQQAWLINNAPANYSGVAFLDKRDPSIRQRIMAERAEAARKKAEDERIAAEERAAAELRRKNAEIAEFNNKVDAAQAAYNSLIKRLEELDATYDDAMQKLNRAAESDRRNGNAVSSLSFYKGTFARAQGALDSTHRQIKEFLAKYRGVLSDDLIRRLEDWDRRVPTYVPVSS